MLKRLIFALFAIGLIAADSPNSLPTQTDLTTEYTQFYHATENMPQIERVAQFRALMASKFPGFYSEERVGVPKEIYDGFIAKSFADFPKIEAQFTARAAALGPQLASALADFRRSFPDAGSLPPTFLVHSLGEMDGGTREIGGKTVLVFGADVIARVHRTDANERPFFQHEIFHTYHEPRFGDCKPLWCALWEEGLATYVSARLNSDAKDDELLLPTEMRRTLDAKRTQAMCAVRSRALSQKKSDYSALFNGGHNVTGLPERSGYYVGYLMAKRLGDGRPLLEIANWKQNDVRPRLLAELSRACSRRRA